MSLHAAVLVTIGALVGLLVGMAVMTAIYLKSEWRAARRYRREL